MSYRTKVLTEHFGVDDMSVRNWTNGSVILKT